ncbi:MAG: DUF5343 domain-containing protein [Christensenella sp.]
MAEQSNSYPTISEKNWWTIREKFKASLPSVVSPNYIKTLLTLSSEASAKSNVIIPLKRLGLVDDDGKPTDLTKDWRLDNKYSSACNIMIDSVYPQELLDLFSDTDVDRSSARDWFMGMGVGQGAADKMVALFALLKNGEIKEIKSTTPKQNKVTPKKTLNKTNSQSEVAQPNHNEDSQERSKHIQTNQPNLHIDLQIHISPESSPEQIEAIFASMEKHLYGAGK